MFGKLLHWLKVPVAEVPDDIAICEFECSNTECRLGDWSHCERRLQARRAEQQERNSRSH